MKYVTFCMIAVVLAALGPNPAAAADNSGIQKEIQALKERIEELEEKLEEQESLAKRRAAKAEAGIEDKIGEALEERFGTLEIHGGAILYYQDSQADELDGENADSPSGAGFTADLELTWHPALPVVEDGEFFVRIHAGNGTGADRTGGGGIKPADVLLANLNTIADDNSGGVNLTGLIPGRDEDTIGIGFAGLVPDSRYAADDPEYHLEVYYRIAVTENLAFTPDLQYVWNPGGDSDNDGIFAGMVRAEFNF